MFCSRPCGIIVELICIVVRWARPGPWGARDVRCLWRFYARRLTL